MWSTYSKSDGLYHNLEPYSEQYLYAHKYIQCRRIGASPASLLVSSVLLPRKLGPSRIKLANLPSHLKNLNMLELV